MSPIVREGLVTLGRIGVRAFVAAAESVLEDVGTAADNVSKSTRKVKTNIGRIARERHREP